LDIDSCAEGFMLGLSTGAACLAYCIPILAPYLLSEGKTPLGNSIDILLFLLGRLIAYLLFAILAWRLGQTALFTAGWSFLLIGAAYIVFALLLILYGFRKPQGRCSGRRMGGRILQLVKKPFLIPLCGGFVMSLGFCSPILLAFTRAAEIGEPLGSLLFFAAFFLGTTVFFLPVPFIGYFRGNSALQIVGRLAAGIMGVYYLYRGIIMLTQEVMVHHG
jgi:hypothetical protein